MKKKVIALLLLLSLITGCAGMTDRDQTMAEGTGGGALIGAGIGALIGQMIGKDTTTTLIGLLFGSLVGGFGGNRYAAYVVDLKKQYATEEQYLNACIAAARDFNTKARNHNAWLSSYNRQLNNEVQDLLGRYNRGQAHLTQLQQAKSEINVYIKEQNANSQEITVEIALQKEVLAQEQHSGSRTALASLDREIRELEQEAKCLTQETIQLASINQRIKI